MKGDSEIPPELVSAYLYTDFRVLEPRRFTLRIGAVSEDLRAVYDELGVASAAFLTAWNPFSRDVSREVNDRAQAALVTSLERAGHTIWSGIGVDPAGEWPGEESVLALGIELEAAKSIGREFQQNAIVWAGEDAIPELVLLR